VVFQRHDLIPFLDARDTVRLIMQPNRMPPHEDGRLS
jgi:hypothetical protein